MLRLRGDIGVFDALHSDSFGRALLIKVGEVSSLEEVADIITGIGANQTAKVEVI